MRAFRKHGCTSGVQNILYEQVSLKVMSLCYIMFGEGIFKRDPMML